MSVDGVVLCADPTPEGGRLAEALRARGYRVVESTPSAVVASASGRVVLLLVLDVDDAEALVALAGFRTLPANAAVPVMLVGGPDAPVHDLTGAVEAGGDAFLARPIAIERAVRKVETYVGRPMTRRASRPADVWDAPPPTDNMPAIPKAARVPEAVHVEPPSPRTDVLPAMPAASPRTDVLPLAPPRPPTPPPEPEPDEPPRDGRDDSTEPPPAASMHVSRTFVLPQQAAPSKRAAPESIDAPPPPAPRERTMVLDPPSRRSAEASTPSRAAPPPPPPPPAPPPPPPPPSSPASKQIALPPPPSLALSFDADEPASPADPSGRVLLSNDLQEAIDAADRRLFGQVPSLSPLFAPADEDIDALVSPDMIEGLRQPLEVEERYEAHDAWTVLGESRAASSPSGGPRAPRDATTGDLAAHSTGPAQGSDPGTPSTGTRGTGSRATGTPSTGSTGSKVRSDPALTPRDRTPASGSIAPPMATPTDLSLRSDEISLRARPRTGMLDARGLLPVLASCIRRRVDGRLTLRAMDGAVSLYLAGGRIVAARTDRRSRSLAWLLVRERRIDQPTARDLDEEAKSSGRGMGTVLLARGLVPGEDLEALERRYQEELVVESIGDSARAGLFELVEGEVALPAGPQLLRSTAALTVAALRRRVEPADALARLGGPGARLRPLLPITRLLEDARLSSVEERAVRALSDRAIGEIADSLGSDVLPALHVLEQLGLLELESNTARAVAAPPPASSASVSTPPREATIPPATRDGIDALPPLPPLRQRTAVLAPSSASSSAPPKPEPVAVPSSRRKIERRRDRPAPPKPPPDPAGPARTLVEEAAALAAEGDYFAVLGLARDASVADIRRAYVARRRELGGLDLAALGLASLSDARALAMEILEEAFSVLRSDELRERYRASL